jgi:hypothetical protein
LSDVRRERERVQRRVDAWREEFHSRAEGPQLRAQPSPSDRAAEAASTQELPAQAPARGAQGLAAGSLLIAAVVASAYVALALMDGGFEPRVYAAASVAVWWAVLIGSALVLWPGGPLPRAAIVTGAALGGFVLLALASTSWASDAGRAFEEGVRALGYLGLFVLVAVAARAGKGRVLLTGLALGLLVIAILALADRLQPGLLPGEPELEQLLPGTRSRLSYPIGYWNGLAAGLAAAIALLAWFGAMSRSRLAAIAATASLPLPVLALYLTDSRGGVIAAILGLLIVVVLAQRPARALGVVVLGIGGAIPLILLVNSEPDLAEGLSTSAAEAAGDRVSVLALAVVVVVGAIASLAPRTAAAAAARLPRPHGLPSIPRALLVGAGVVAIAAAVIALDPVERIEEFGSFNPSGSRGDLGAREVTSTAGGGRAQYWESALDAFADEPLSGLGAGGFETWWNQHGELSQSVQNAHSLFVESLAELGVGGLALILVFVGVPLVVGARRALAAGRGRVTDDVAVAGLALLVAGCASAAADWTWELPAAFAPVVVAAALLTAPTLRAPATRSISPRASLWRVAAVLAAGAAVCASAVVWIAELKLGASREAAVRDDLAEAASEARAAADLQPWSAEPHTQLALIDRARHRPEAALREITEAIDRSPEDWSLRLLSAQFHYRVGDYVGEHAALAAAVTLAPRLPLALFVDVGETKTRGGSAP